MSRSYVSQVELGRIQPAQDYLDACEAHYGLPVGALSTTVPTTDTIRVPAAATVLESARHLEPVEPRVEPRNVRLRDVPDKLCSAEEVQAAMESMLAAAPPSGAHEKVVLSTLCRSTGSFGRHLPPWLASAISRALTNGWEVEHLLHLDLGRTDAADDIRQMINLLACAGRYEPFTVSPGIECAFDVLAVPGVGVLLFAEGRGYRHEESGDRYEDFLFSHARAIRRRSSHLFTRYRNSESVESVARYLRVAALEQEPGDCFVVTDRLSAYARPLAYWESDERRRWRYPGWLDDKRSVLEAFGSDRLFHQYREIASKASLENFLNHGLFLGVSPRNTPALPRERAAVLSHLIGLLSDPAAKYDLRLEEPSSRLALTRDSWIYKDTPEGAFVFVHAADEHGSMHIEITEPTLTEHFRRQFDLAWNALNDSGNRREFTIDWLERQARNLSAMV